MSDQQNMFDNLRSDEEASIESDEIGSSTADFFVDDEVPVRVVPGPRSDDVLATVDQEVPYMYMYINKKKYSNNIRIIIA